MNRTNGGLSGHAPTRADHTIRATHVGVLTYRDRFKERGLPEHSSYKDDGCSFFHSCLACPFESCRYDPGFGRLDQHSRLAAFATEVAEGKSPWEAAKVLGISDRTAYRYRDQLAEGTT